MMEALDEEDSGAEMLLVEGGPQSKQQERRVGVVELVFLLYFLSCGGPFGTEAAVGAAGGALTIVSLFVVALFWSLPQAIVGAELSLIACTNGGSVDWVKRAFKSDFCDHMNAFNLLFSSVTSYSLLVVLIVAYLPLSNVGLIWLLKITLVIVAGVINVLGPESVAHFSLLLIILVFIPFVALAITVIAQGQLPIAAQSLARIPAWKSIRMEVWIPTVVWSFGGFDSVGNIAGEVKGGRRTFLMGLGITFPLVLMTYLFPTIIGLGVAPDYWSNATLWVSGGYSLIAAEQYEWLGVLMDASGALSNFGQYCASVVALARVVAYCGTVSVLPWVVSISHTKDNVVRPVVAIFLVSVLMLVMTAISFESMVQMYLHCRLVNLLFIFAAFIRLRYIDPSPRVFHAPGGIWMAWLYGLPSLLIGLGCLWFTESSIWLWTLVFQALVVAIFVCKKLYQMGARGAMVRLVGRNIS